MLRLFGLSISVHLSVCVSIAIGAASSQCRHRAGGDSDRCHRLPAYLPLDDTIRLQSDARYDALPLPRGEVAQTPNPFRDDSPDDTAVSHTTPALAGPTRTDDATDPADGSAPLGPQAAALSRESRRDIIRARRPARPVAAARTPERARNRRRRLA